MGADVIARGIGNNAKEYAKQFLTLGTEYQGILTSYANLPTTGLETGYWFICNFTDSGHSIVPGNILLYNGTTWDKTDFVITGDNAYLTEVNVNGFVGSIDDWSRSKNSSLGFFSNNAALLSEYPIPTTVGEYPIGTTTGIHVDNYKFAIINDISGSGVVSIAAFNNVHNRWDITKLNQAIPISSSGDAIGFSGSSSARIGLISNADWNNKEFMYLDQDLHILMLYKPGCEYLQFNGQIVDNNAPAYSAKLNIDDTDNNTWTNGELWRTRDDIMRWNSTNRYWKNTGITYITEDDLNMGMLEKPVSRNTYSQWHYDAVNRSYTFKLVQRAGTETVIYTLETEGGSSTTNIVNLDQTNDEVIIEDDFTEGAIYSFSATVPIYGAGGTIMFRVLDGHLYRISETRQLLEIQTFISCTTQQRLNAISESKYMSDKFIFDMTLNKFLVYDANQSCCYEYRGELEDATFTATPANNVAFTSSSTGRSYIWNNANKYWSLTGTLIKATTSSVSSDRDFSTKVKAWFSGRTNKIANLLGIVNDHEEQLRNVSSVDNDDKTLTTTKKTVFGAINELFNRRIWLNTNATTSKNTNGTKVNDARLYCPTTSGSDGNILVSNGANTSPEWQIRSHVGQIIMSTTLDTQAKVIAIYGGTTWSRVQGRVLYGADSSHASGTTGGNNSVTLTTSQLPAHGHAAGTLAANNWKLEFYGGENNNAWGSVNNYSGLDVIQVSPLPKCITRTDAAGSTGRSYSYDGDVHGLTATTGTGAAIDITPAYKACYIW